MTAFLTRLSADDLRAAGIPAPWAFGQADRVRFYELDALNHVNNTVYLKWFETLRVQYMIDYGLTQYRPEDPSFVVRSLTCDFLAPMFLNDDYIVTARCESFRTTSFRKDYAVWRGGRLCATGTAVVVMTDKSGERKQPLTDAQRETFVTRDGARDDR
jgi:acyl-CoA thioester hydrolase